jgi:hypothetical protein
MSGQSDESVETAGSTDEGLVGEGGLGRRSLIKKAGIVGAAAWAAPMVLDSVLSPASAASLPPGKYKLRLSTQACNPTPVQDPNVAQACLPIDWPAATNSILDATMLANLGLTVSNCSRRYQLTLTSSNANVTILSGTSCKPKAQGGGPYDGVVAPGGASIVWGNGGASDRNGYFIVINVA